MTLSAKPSAPHVHLLFLFLWGTCSSLAAQQPFTIPRASGPIVLDGTSNERSWQNIVPLPVVMLLPEAGAEPTERTEIRLAHDDEFLYVAGRLYDSDPSGVQANSRMRDNLQCS